MSGAPVGRLRAFIAAAAVLFGAAATAQPLTPDALLASSAASAPAILEAMARSRAADGEALAARGAFDLVFSGSSTSYVGGFYDGVISDVGAARRFAGLGARAYGGYRVSRGDFPIYEDENFTNEGGEARIGVVFSLLRDRAIDDARYTARDARLAADAARIEQTLAAVGVQHRALRAYWRWVAAGRKLAVYEDLVRLAEERQTNLETEVRSGARARIFLTENRQNLLRRRALEAEALRAFETAAIALSFYYRDEDGEPATPQRRDLPAPSAGLGLPHAFPGDDPDVLIASRPELQVLRTSVDRARNDLRLARNELSPKLDFKAEASSDFGDVGVGGVSRDATDVKLGVEFSVPLQRRAARGASARAEAELAALRQRERIMRDRIDVELRSILMSFDATRTIADIAEEEVEQAEAMSRAERQRFSSGASDFFLVNLREEAAADSRIRLYDAVLGARLADADYRAAAVDTQALALSDALRSF